MVCLIIAHFYNIVKHTGYISPELVMDCSGDMARLAAAGRYAIWSGPGAARGKQTRRISPPG